MQKCPFCERTYFDEVEGWRALAIHLLDDHGGKEFNRRVKSVGLASAVVSCWCGEYYEIHEDAKRSSFAWHLAAVGGPVNHLIALGMNLKEEKE
jgi:hypothetical protein